MTTKKKKTAKTKTKRKNSGKPASKKQVVAFVSVIVLLVAILGGIILNASTKPRTPVPYDFKKDRAYGIDVSSHNGKIDWETVKDEVDFAFIRVGCRGYTDGNIALDKKANANMKNAEKAGVPFGVYIYSQAISEEEAIEEAEFLIKHVKGHNVKLPLVIDFEYATKDGKHVGRLADAKLSRKERTALINAFCKTVKEAGYIPALYASSNIYKTQISVRSLEDGVVLWVADYNKRVTYNGDYDIWQFSEKGKCKGVSSKYVDTNYWYNED